MIRSSGARGRWGERLLVLRGGIVIPGASSWPWPVVRPSGYYRLSISETVDKFIPVLLVGCFLNPVLERAAVVDGDFRYVGKEETQVSQRPTRRMLLQHPVSTSLLLSFRRVNCLQ
jgi:hypothetical protein